MYLNGEGTEVEQAEAEIDDAIVEAAEILKPALEKWKHLGTNTEMSRVIILGLIWEGIHDA